MSTCRLRLASNVLLLAVVLAVAACGGGSATITTQANPKAVIKIGMADLPATAAPYGGVGSPGQYVWAQIYDAVTYIGPDGKVQPMLATSWTNPSPTMWVFKIRTGVTFSNGEAADAFAAAKNIVYLIGPEGKALFPAHTGNYTFIASANASDASTLTITTKTPNLLVPNVMALMYVVPPAYWTQVGPKGFEAKPIGSGAFTVTSWASDKVVLAKRTSGFWRPAPKAAGLEFDRIKDPAARVQALQSGQVDIAENLSPDQAVAVTAAGLKTFNGPTGQVMSLALINTNPSSPMAKPEVRRALNYAVDKDSIVKNLFHGNAKAGVWPTPGINGYDASRVPYPYDPVKAKQLLAAAGYPNGFSFTAEVVTGSYPADGDTYQAMAGYFKAIGVNVTLQQVDFATQWLPKFTGKVKWAGEAFGLSWNSAPLIDAIRPFNFYQCRYSAPFYCDPVAQPMIDAVNSATDPTTRNSDLAKLLDYTYQVPPAVWLVEVPGLWAYSKKVQGFSVAYYNIPGYNLALTS